MWNVISAQRSVLGMSASENKPGVMSTTTMSTLSPLKTLLLCDLGSSEKPVG